MTVDGTYEVTLEVMGKQANGSVEVKAEGSKLVGTIQGMGMSLPLEEGRISGQNFSGVVAADTPMGKMRFKLSGKVEGDLISGTIKSGLMGGKFSGKRVS